MTRNFIAIGLAAASLFAAAPAAAAPWDSQFRIAVPTAGLDLATSQGRRQLAGRADAAARGVCGPVLTFHRSGESIGNACRAEVRARVKAAAMRRALGASHQLAGR